MTGRVLFPALVLCLMAVLSGFSGVLANFLSLSPDQADLGQRYLPASPAHILGTDELGRDVFLRLLSGGRISLTVGLVAATLCTLTGTLIGLVAGWAGGRLDALLMRLTDILISLPMLPLLIILSAIDLEELGLPPDIAQSPGVSLCRIILLISLMGWTGTARLVRARTLALKNADYVRAAAALGAGTGRILARHILPNLMNTVTVAATLAAGNIILMESVLSFLGLGITPPMASWGNMLTRAADNIWGHAALAVWPGVMIFVTVMAFNLLGDALQEEPGPKKPARA